MSNRTRTRAPLRRDLPALPVPPVRGRPAAPEDQCHRGRRCRPSRATLRALRPARSPWAGRADVTFFALRSLRPRLVPSDREFGCIAGARVVDDAELSVGLLVTAVDHTTGRWDRRPGDASRECSDDDRANGAADQVLFVSSLDLIELLFMGPSCDEPRKRRVTLRFTRSPPAYTGAISRQTADASRLLSWARLREVDA